MRIESYGGDKLVLDVKVYVTSHESVTVIILLLAYLDNYYLVTTVP